MPTVDELRNMTPEQLAEHADAQITRLVLALFPDLDVRLTRHDVCDALASYATRKQVRRALDQLCLTAVLAEVETRNKDAVVHTYHLVPTTRGAS